MNLGAENIAFEDEYFLVLNKPAGVLSQKDKSGDADAADLLQNYFLQKKGKRLPFLAPVHRLDRNTSGLLVFAKSSDSARKFTEALQSGDVKRKYSAIVKGNPGEAGTIDAPLAKDEESNETYISSSGKIAVTHFKRLKQLPATSLVEVELETGRSHQIRAHFAHIKCALIGDKKYAKKPWSEIFHRPALHAHELTLVHPYTKKEMLFSAPVPEDMKKLLLSLQGNS